MSCLITVLRVYYTKSNGHDFADGIRLLFDDNSVRAMVSVCIPYGKIQVYVDSSLWDENNVNNVNGGDDDLEDNEEELENMMKGYEEEFGSDDDSDPDDPAYMYESGQETEELDSGASDVDEKLMRSL